MVAIWAGIVPALLAQSGSWYSEEEAARRLAHIQEVAASSGGKIEITVIRLTAAGDARAHGPLADLIPAELPAAPGLEGSYLAAPSSLVLDAAAVAADTLGHGSAAWVPWGGEFTPRKNPDLVWQQQFDCARKLEQKGSLHHALRILLELTYSHPDHPRCAECYFQMGECLTALGKPALAQRAFRQVLQFRESALYDDALLRIAAGLGRH